MCIALSTGSVRTGSSLSCRHEQYFFSFDFGPEGIYDVSGFYTVNITAQFEYSGSIGPDWKLEMYNHWYGEWVSVGDLGNGELPC